MHMTTTTTPNSRVARKSLASQIDRLDSLLDGLAENLNDAVATAVREAVQQAVQKAVETVVREVLTNATLLRTLQGPAEPVSPTPRTDGRRPTSRSLGASLRQVNAIVRTEIGQVQARLTDLLQQTSALLQVQRDQWASRCWGLWQVLPGLLLLVWRRRQSLLLAVGIGSLVGLSCYFAGPLLASLTSGLSSIVLTLVAQALLPFRGLRFVGAGREVAQAELRPEALA
jgi:hypothetical protein